jgi:hypothetical protein
MMDFNSISEEVLDAMTDLLSQHLEEQLAEQEGTKLSDIENVMRRLLQKIGQCSLEKLLTQADDVQPAVRCKCGGEAQYVARREAKLITVFGKVTYRRAYHFAQHVVRAVPP